ncbi:PQQ-binding-like beta-propeller repeat protein [Methanolobus sp. ZRKC2]|uniref:outer membrane protein assembly factor BamB family protein n=1 Tax=Methanolobus sp. ZRKC2 TaxID=3125783 RepID=UPI0032543175
MSEKQKERRSGMILVVLLVFSALFLTAIPANAAIFEVTNSSELVEALGKAQNGDQMYLEAGNYSSITVSKSGIKIIGKSADKVIFDNDGDNIELKAEGCVLQDVTVINSPKGVEIEADNCEIRGCVFEGLTHSTGIYVKGNNLLFENNVVTNATGKFFAVYGLWNGGTYKNNLFINNDCAALSLYINSENNIVSNNNFINNKHGLHLWGPGAGNRIYLNNFIGNTDDVKETEVSSTVYWTSDEQISYMHDENQFSSYLGNYWDDYDCGDNDNNGILDSPYELSSSLGVDQQPLLLEFENYIVQNGSFVDLLPVDFQTSSSLTAQQPNIVKVTIKNAGDLSSGYCKVLLLDENNVIDSQILSSIEPGNTSVVAYTLLPTEGYHSLTVRVDSENVVNESNENNNEISKTVAVDSVSIDENWHQFHKDVQHTGFYPGQAPSTSEILWISDSIDAVHDSSPVVADGKVFVNTGIGNPDDPTGGGEESQIVALDMYTGEFAGSYGPGSTFYGSWASPCFYEGNVSCARPDSVIGGNMIVNGKVYVGDFDGYHYHCYYESNGTEIWSFPVEGKAMSTPAYSDGRVYLTSLTSSGYNSGGYVYCIDAETSEEIWRISTRDDATGTPSIYNDIIYATTYNWDGDGEIYAIDKNDGTIIWQNDIMRTNSCPAVAYGNVYVSGGCFGWSKIQTYCFNAITGELVWETPDGWAGIGGWTNSPVVADGKVYIGYPDDAYGYKGTFCLDAFTGKTIWKYQGGGSAPAISDGILYTIGIDGKVYAFGNLTDVILPVANFESNVTYGQAPLTVAFVDTSINATSWKWDFESDGVLDSTDQNPQYTYTVPGVYAVTLNVSNAIGSDIETKVEYITVGEWNPWNDPDSDSGAIITNSELQHAIYCWQTGEHAPYTDEIIINARMQALVYYWLEQADMPNGVE